MRHSEKLLKRCRHTNGPVASLGATPITWGSAIYQALPGVEPAVRRWGCTPGPAVEGVEDAAAGSQLRERLPRLCAQQRGEQRIAHLRAGRPRHQRRHRPCRKERLSASLML